MIPPSAVLGLLFALALIAVVAGVAGLAVRTQRRQRAFRTQRAMEVASAGWYPVPPDPWLQQVGRYLYPQGKPGKPGETYAGVHNGRPMCVLDYSYVVNSGNSQATHTGNLVVLTLPVALPPITVRRETSLLRTMHGHGLELENQQFNEKFRIECGDDRYGSAVMHPRMMECVLRNPGLQWHIAGNAFVSWSYGPFSMPDVFARLDAMSALIDRIPPFVLRDYGIR